MWKQFTVQGNTVYLDILRKLLKQFNNTEHSSIKMTPVEASKKKNESTLYFNLYGDMEQLSSKPTILDKSPRDSTAIFIFFCHFSVPS